MYHAQPSPAHTDGSRSGKCCVKMGAGCKGEIYPHCMHVAGYLCFILFLLMLVATHGVDLVAPCRAATASPHPQFDHILLWKTEPCLLCCQLMVFFGVCPKSKPAAKRVESDSILEYKSNPVFARASSSPCQLLTDELLA